MMLLLTEHGAVTVLRSMKTRLLKKEARLVSNICRSVIQKVRISNSTTT
ncbi:unnamed protein product [Amoebophrya sp. A25]|nr:unnamed protein product [Amoebophrya sp. A25]|eukprot:GSA25T00026958001.1